MRDNPDEQVIRNGVQEAIGDLESMTAAILEQITLMRRELELHLRCLLALGLHVAPEAAGKHVLELLEKEKGKGPL